MKKLRNQKGITLMVLIITVILLMIFTGVTIYNTNGSFQIQKMTRLINDVEELKGKVLDYYNEYGKIPAKVEYTNLTNLINAGILSDVNDTGKFYVIDLEAMQGITLTYGKDYEIIKDETRNLTGEAATEKANAYTDVYIINEDSHNIFLVKGVTTKDNGKTNTYYTDYTSPDNTKVDLRYIDGIVVPNGYYYIGKQNDGSGFLNIIISKTKDDSIDTSNANQYVWTRQISEIDKKPDSVNLTDGNNGTEKQSERDFVKSVNYWKGYFRNTNGNVVYVNAPE